MDAFLTLVLNQRKGKEECEGAEIELNLNEGQRKGILPSKKGETWCVTMARLPAWWDVTLRTIV